MENINDFELHDFIADANFDQFIDLMRGDHQNEDPVANFGCDDLLNGCFVDTQQFIAPNSGFNNVFGFNDTMVSSSIPNSTLFVDTMLPRDFNGEMIMAGDEENDEENSSGTTTTTTPTKRPKVDRSRTLISERRRRGRLKEKLYALRALVPNITKMDKASIVGDAVLYVQELQTQAKKLKAEIESLEASLEEADRYQGSTGITKKPKAAKASDSHVAKTTFQMDMFQVEEREFYVKVVCNKGEGAAISLYKALESLTSFNIQNSNLATVSETFALTFTLNVKCDQQEPINLPNLKLWVTGAFLNQGFQLKTDHFSA
ncbi:transcription factor FER-LIKE IRON DEFICIENCY-INDUCED TRANSCRIPTION FACTOR [Morus notabilis]|uniref:transcription factor FER-LIKE IRON DEFICIENCY-INDUCED TRANSCRIPTION FACTOR n=1 Tax=Morus notabilis TaxID=981085 RepID=UPI000CED0A35|nr:transcription factor FER-LIKE IRON DEFICIENCY-INDUCED TRANSCRIPTION FACTOR [Morus notabilis]